MNVEEAKVFLNTLERSELRDHAFGDKEIYWSKPGEKETLACGYLGGDISEVTIGEHRFEGQDAYDLSRCGIRGAVSRNDKTGPQTFELGKTKSELTLEGVLKELTNHI